MKRRSVGFVLLALCVAALSTGCSSISTAPDQVGLHYKGGAYSSTTFANCVPPGRRNWDGPGDPHYVYPAGQRTYRFGQDAAADHPAIRAVTEDNVQMEFTGTVTFYVDQDCEMLRRFHEQIGLKDWDGAPAYVDEGYDGWNAMLDVYVGQPLQRAIGQTAADFGYRDLYNNNESRMAAEAEIQKALPEYVEQLAQDKFFRGISIALQKPDAPSGIRAALEAEQEAVAQNKAQVQKNATARTQYETFTDCKQVLSETNCVLLYGINSGKVTILPVPDGTDLSVPSR